VLSTVFNNQRRSGYEEVFAYGPYFYADLLEMDVNYRFAGYTLDLMAEKLETLMNDQFIDFADEQTIERWEKWLAIFPDATQSLDDRRKKVKLLRYGVSKFNGSLIKSMVMSYTGISETPSVVMTTHLTIKAQIKSDNNVFVSDLIKQIERMKPAQILFELILVSTTVIKILTRIRHYVFPYDKCGLKPEIATLGDYQKDAVIAYKDDNDYVYPHRKASAVSQVGIHPDLSTIGDYAQTIISADSEISENVYGYRKSSETQESGTYPNIATVGQMSQDNVSIDTSVSSSALYYVECGTTQAGEEGL
jgi:hypothetical protein